MISRETFPGAKESQVNGYRYFVWVMWSVLSSQGNYLGVCLIANSTKKTSQLHRNSTFVVYNQGVPGEGTP